ncbi:hypothetical protein DE146DRAFT_759592 [Phaeosphaeria sp. MPI-PUGE-AT-0046c]|nr:hypothetical protein DE146DRAFT_759592 [Phaeosphaeria sp. MPI-PUGE-AT-0046c]
MHAMKREEHSASPDLSKVPAPPSHMSREALEATNAHKMQLPPAVSSTLRPYNMTTHAHLTLGPYFGSSPRKHRIGTLYHQDGQTNPLTPPLSRFPSRSASAMATTPGHVIIASTTTTTTNGHAATPCISNITNIPIQQFQDSQQPVAAEPRKMDEYLGNANQNVDDVHFGSLPATNLREHDDEIFVSRSDLEELQYGVQLLRNEHATSEEKVQNQGVLITELITFSQRMHVAIEHLNERIKAVESANLVGFHPTKSFATPVPAVQSVLRSRGDNEDGRSRSPSPDREGYRDRNMKGQKKKGRKDLAISIPGKLYVPPTAANTLPTPSSSFTHVPTTPITPGRTGPPLSAKRISTCVNKRNIHNLDQMVPPAYAHIPLLPLTDTEIIVYLFNSLCRPIVSLRLYARGWGPAAISDVVNTHRIVEPAYLRNTCSVKCTTAIKKGNELYGEQWSTTNREIFQDATTLDDKATDMIRLSPSEIHLAVDFEIRALCNGLKKHPEDCDGSIFTRCVKYCEETNAAYKLSDVFELASDLEAGRTPRRRQTPAQERKSEDPPSSTRID